MVQVCQAADQPYLEYFENIANFSTRFYVGFVFQGVSDTVAIVIPDPPSQG